MHTYSVIYIHVLYVYVQCTYVTLMYSEVKIAFIDENGGKMVEM